MYTIGDGLVPEVKEDFSKIAIDFINGKLTESREINSKRFTITPHWGAESLWVYDNGVYYCIAVRIALPDEENRKWGGYYAYGGYLHGIGMGGH